MTIAIDDEWQAALADAGFGEGQAKLHCFPRNADLGGGRQAVYQAPGDYLLVRPEQQFLEVLNADQDLHRVGIASDLEPFLVAGVLRHELEHARQFDRLGRGIFRIHDLIAMACWEKTGRSTIGGAHLINLAPIELDANAAAARFAWSRHHERVADYLQSDEATHQVLFRYEGGPEPIETLLLRTLAFATTLADLCERVSAQHRGKPFRECVEDHCAGASVLWDQVHSNADEVRSKG